MGFNRLRASDGTGNAVLAHVQTNRSIGSTVIDVDSVSKWPTTYIAVSGTLLPSGFLDPTTITEFRGHTTAGDVIIDSYEAGYTDLGHTVGQVIILKQTTGWVNHLLDTLATFFNDDGTAKTGVVLTSPKAITGINDTNNNELIRVTPTASAVNDVTVTNAITATAPVIAASGDDANVSLSVMGKGTGRVLVQELLITPSSTNYAAAWGADVVLATLTVPAQPVATRVWLTGAIEGMSLGSAPPTTNNICRIRQGVGGTIVASQLQAKTAASGITEVRPFNLTGYYDLAANTSATFILTGTTDGAASLSVGEQTTFYARVVGR